mgnify:CR=1 FL=1
MYPVIVASQTIPTTAIAPLFILWFGYGIWSKVLVTILMTFFPIAITVFDGLKGTKREMEELGANTPAPSSWVIMRLLKYPRPFCAPSHSAIAAPITLSGTDIFTAEKKCGRAVGSFSLINLNLVINFPANINDGISLPAAGKADVGIYYLRDTILTSQEENIPIVSIGAVFLHHYSSFLHLISFRSIIEITPTAAIATTESSTTGANTPAPSSWVIMRLLKYPRR